MTKRIKNKAIESDEESEAEEEPTEETEEPEGDSTETTGEAQETPKRRNRARPVTEKLINYGFEEDICEKANEIYMIITRLKSYRKNNWKMLIMFCVYYAGIELHDEVYMLAEEICKLIDLDISFIPKAFTMFCPAKNDYQPPNKDVTVEFSIGAICSKHFNLSNEAVKHLKEVATCLLERCKIFCKIKPQRVAIGLIYYYLKTNNIKFKLKRFTNDFDISHNTLEVLRKQIIKYA